MTAPSLRPAARARRRARASTLIEMAAVVSVISIMSAVSYLSYRTFTERSEEQAIVGEMESVWQDIRARAEIGRFHDPLAVTADAFAEHTTNWTFNVNDDLDARWVSGHNPHADDPQCVRMVVPATTDVEYPPMGPCDLLAFNSIKRLEPGGWWPLNDRAGTATVSAEFGEPGTPTGVTFEEPPAPPHAALAEKDDFFSVVAAGAGGVQATDPDGWSDPGDGDGVTMMTFARFGGTTATLGTGTLMQIGAAGAEVLRLGFSDPAVLAPECVAGDGSTGAHVAASAAALTPDPADGTWYLLACRANRDGSVSLVVNGHEAARTTPPAGWASAWSPGTEIWPVGGPGGFTGPWGADDPAIFTTPLDDALLGALHHAALTDATP